MSPASSGDRSAATSVGFHTTHWTVILAAQGADTVAAQDALASLCSTYWYPLYAYIRHKGLSPHEAEDLTQEFFHRFLQRNSLIQVQQGMGKFRSFLLACLKNFLANERDRAQAQRRGGGQTIVSLDGAEAETRYAMEPIDTRTPEDIFERRWAVAVLERTMADLERECARDEKADLFRDFQGFLPGGGETLSRQELAARRGVTVAAVDVAIHRLRQRFGALLRSEVRKTVSSEAEVDEEIRYLIATVGRR